MSNRGTVELLCKPGETAYVVIGSRVFAMDISSVTIQLREKQKTPETIIWGEIEALDPFGAAGTKRKYYRSASVGGTIPSEHRAYLTKEEAEEAAAHAEKDQNS